MNEVDDRLAGDPVWELFPYSAPTPSQEGRSASRYRRWVALACLVAACWLLYPRLAVVAVCLSVAARDFRAGRRLGRSIPDKAGGSVCARFTCAWGAWKLGLTAFGLMFLTITVSTGKGAPREVPPAFIAAMFLWMGGFALSAILTASGLLKAYRSGMRVWIGQGVNQARTLLLGMLVTAFTVGVLGPMCLWLAGMSAPARERPAHGLWFGVGFFGCMFGGPLVILLILDWVSRRVVADRPGKFGAKVPTVGKWNS